eukprot:130992-Chlamydomonas_euryale.AAC.6
MYKHQSGRNKLKEARPRVSVSAIEERCKAAHACVPGYMQRVPGCMQRVPGYTQRVPGYMLAPPRRPVLVKTSHHNATPSAAHARQPCQSA